ncbi:amidohydrolase family protein [Aliiglaciecola sp. 2_MG-2023]|uniref:N-acyl-D-amino-acid deacylase family protein n=1 Tax=unclassified Aliiglaciecola TaxID=2593648 RepID=UPI0026E1AAC6|nr:MULTISPECIES: amidohydrolase family protein [unclassified Aliiglaciecola]MDO6711118.1 amidohydrolase family protein [Aliiglaciecola sp. 2_MG-2023]MDO6752032.1 amidohydrolase family protein [Aliiglaciecola sp. 1_MG-2023]
MYNNCRLRFFSILFVAIASCAACTQKSESIDMIITGKNIYTGNEQPAFSGYIGIDKGNISFISDTLPAHITATQTIDAGDKIIAPGFIDTHTHACNDFGKDSPNTNVNYTTQGVTTVFCNVDGGGSVDVAAKLNQYEQQGIGTNVVLYVGHGSIRKAVMGIEDRAPTDAELEQMKSLVEQAMKAGALGLSTGLYYVPGNYAMTSEVVELAKVAAQYNGAYDSHIRDESSYSIGLVNAIKEVIQIGQQADIPVHVAHIKSLGVDVWGKSAEVIKLIDEARQQGIDVTADQYPWRASGTSVAGSLVPRYIMAGSKEAYHARMEDDALWPTLKLEMAENLRRRGGAESLLISDPKRPDIRGKTLAEVASLWEIEPIDAARQIILEGNARVASFNMSDQDMKAYMTQSWVMTSSDGSTGHPRKYGTFPKKFREYVKQKGWLSTQEFIQRSSYLPAKTFGLTGRGELKAGYVADIVIFNPETYQQKASYLQPTELSEGVEWLIVNGQPVIEQSVVNQTLAGQPIRQSSASR